MGTQDYKSSWRTLTSLGAFLSLTLAGTAGMAADTGTGYRLPTALRPSHYWINLVPTFESEDFLTNGSVRIYLTCVNATSQVVFSLNEIDIDTASVSLTTEDGGAVPILGQKWNNETQMYTISLGSPLVPESKYYLAMKFSYKLNENLEGFYRSSYKDLEGKKRWLATTQFSPINARRAFPCWDEPSFKAVFNISLGRHVNMTTVSNMPTFLTAPMNEREDWVWDHHETTLPVSTYLIAFIVTDLPHREVNNTSNPQFKVWSRPDILDQMKYIGEISPKVLSFIADYFNTPFPLQKIDLFAVPDFGFSAMENWGLITFAEPAIKVSKTIAHELAHQWFGNLVTPQWWDDLWLKEGFATFVGVTALDGVNGNTNESDKWIVDELHHSMFEDSLFASHPVSNPVDYPRKIWQAFDAISYEKGSSIIRMMCDFLGEDVFREGLNAYLKNFAFGNARREQLWDCYSGSSQENVSTVMDRWTLQTGYPVLNLTRQYPADAFSLTQERFLLNGSREDKSLWHVPYTYTYKSDNGEKRNVSWLTNRGDFYVIEGLPRDDWLLINLKRSGYYRVNYDLQNWALLTEDFQNLPRLSRVQLINDAFNLALANRLDYNVPFRLSGKLRDTADDFLWNVTIVEVTNIARILTGTELLPAFEDYALTLFHSENLTYSSEEKVLVKFASSLGLKSLIKQSVQAMHDLMESKNISYPESVLGSLYCSGVRNSGQEVWDFIWKRYVEERRPEEKSRLVTALACSTSPANLNRLLAALLSDDSGVRKQEAKLVFTQVSNNELGRALSLDFLVQNWDKIKDRYGLGYKIMSSMVLSLGPVLNEQSQLEKVQKLYNDHLSDLGSTSNAFLNTLERVQININWLKNHYNSVKSIVKNEIK